MALISIETGAVAYSSTVVITPGMRCEQVNALHAAYTRRNASIKRTLLTFLPQKGNPYPLIMQVHFVQGRVADIIFSLPYVNGRPLPHDKQMHYLDACLGAAFLQRAEQIAPDGQFPWGTMAVNLDDRTGALQLILQYRQVGRYV